MTDGMADWRSRTKLLFGEDGADRIAAGSVIIAGLGAVGSFAAEALARNGVGHLILIDFDTVEPSNVNRQLYALSSTVGKSKTDIALERILDINPNCDVKILQSKIASEEAQVADTLEIFGEVDIILDAIDDVEAKTALMLYGITREIPIVSSMGAARRLNPTLVRTGALKDVNSCPLAKCVRKSLRAKLTAAGITGLESLDEEKICCVYSTEKPLPQVYIQECGPRAMGSSICVTGTFGLTAASAVLRQLVRP